MATQLTSRMVALAVATGLAAIAGPAAAQVTCTRTIVARVSAIDVPIMFNRLGAQNPNWMAYVLDADLKTLNPPVLRDDKRVRPLVLRVAAGECLEVRFTNRLTQNANPNNAINPANQAAFQVNDQIAERRAGFHAQGLELVSSIADDASYVGRNASSLAAPVGGFKVYKYYAPKEGSYLVTNPGAPFGGDATAGNSGSGQFAVVNVEPKGARFYRNNVTEEDPRLATTGTTQAGQPIIGLKPGSAGQAPGPLKN